MEDLCSHSEGSVDSQQCCLDRGKHGRDLWGIAVTEVTVKCLQLKEAIGNLKPTNKKR